jgi:hypothetical protein
VKGVGVHPQVTSTYSSGRREGDLRRREVMVCLYEQRHPI